VEIGNKLFAYCPRPLLPGNPQAKPFWSSNLLNPVVCEHRPCFVSAFEEKFSKVYVSAHPGKQGPPSGQSWWLTRQKSLVRICKFRKLSVRLYHPNLGIRAHSSIYIYQGFAELTVLVSVPNMCQEKNVKSCLQLLQHYQWPELMKSTSNKLANTLVPENKNY